MRTRWRFASSLRGAISVTGRPGETTRSSRCPQAQTSGACWPRLVGPKSDPESTTERLICAGQASSCPATEAAHSDGYLNVQFDSYGH